MASGPEAESSPHDEGLSALVRRIQIGDQTAIQAFHSMFLPGIEFLLRRKLEKSTVAAEAARECCKRPFKRSRLLPRPKR